MGFQSSIQLGAATSIRAAAVLSNAYVRSSTVDLLSYDSVILLITVASPESGTGRVCNLKFGWGQADGTWADEPFEVIGTASGSEIPSVPYSRRVDISIDSANGAYMGTYIVRLRRLARYFSIAVKSSATTTATIAAAVIKESNQN